MTLMETAQLLGSFGEFFGAVAVAVTLVFLVIQVKHSSGLMESSIRTAAGETNHERTIERLAFNGQMANDAELARIWASGCADASLEDSDQIRFDLLCDSHWNLWRGTWNRAELIARHYYDRVARAVPDGNWATEEIVWELHGKPGLQRYWRRKVEVEIAIYASLYGRSTQSKFASDVQRALETVSS